MDVPVAGEASPGDVRALDPNLLTMVNHRAKRVHVRVRGSLPQRLA